MHQEQGKSGWVIISCEAESILENLLGRLEASGVSPERLTLVRLEREQAERTWPSPPAAPAHRQTTATARGNDERPSHGWVFNDALWSHSLLWGAILGVIGLILGLRSYPADRVFLLTLLFFLGGSITALIVARFRGGWINPRREVSHPASQSAGNMADQAPARVDPILVGIKISRHEIGRVEEIAREVVTKYN